MHDESKIKPEAIEEGADPARRNFIRTSALAGLAGAAGLALAGCGRKGDHGGAEGGAALVVAGVRRVAALDPEQAVLGEET